MNEILTLYCGLMGVLLMAPGALIPDIGHLKQIFVQTGSPEHILEDGLMSGGAAGGHYHPVEAVFLYFLRHLFLGIL
jgi:hypothetical protein